MYIYIYKCVCARGCVRKHVYTELFTHCLLMRTHVCNTVWRELCICLFPLICGCAHIHMAEFIYIFTYLYINININNNRNMHMLHVAV